ncbi:MAG: biotin-dependent carboxyltransferase family protein [Bacteroidota bacterium]|nr:biotin-dependent carboxyltransferase family protein [Bacteroidota bacterium]
MSLKIIKAGLLDTIQDTGRYGYQHQGINPGGAMDRYSASLANALLGKALPSPVIEMHFPAAQILFERPCVICLTGADFTPLINSKEAPLHQPIAVRENMVLSFGGRRNGARCYLSVLNELQIEPWLNSYSTNLKAGAGGYKGRRLATGDEISFESIDLTLKDDFIALPWSYHLPYMATNEVQFIPGQEWNWLTTKSQTAFLNNGFTISPASDRMGYCLQGEYLEQNRKEQLISSAVSFGTVQLLPTGQVIILMADHQTTGGYPRIANIISVDLPKLAQMSPNSVVKFTMTNIETAEEKMVAQQNYLYSLQNTCNLKMQKWLDAHRY